MCRRTLSAFVGLKTARYDTMVREDRALKTNTATPHVAERENWVLKFPLSVFMSEEDWDLKHTLHFSCGEEDRVLKFPQKLTMLEEDRTLKTSC